MWLGCASNFSPLTSLPRYVLAHSSQWPTGTQSPELLLGSISSSFGYQKRGKGRKENNKILIFPHSSLWAFVPQLMMFGGSPCFAIYHFGMQIKGLLVLLISCFSFEAANSVLFGCVPWGPPWWLGPERT